MMSQEILELGTFEETRVGIPLKFKVTTVPQEYIEDVIQLMNKYFLPREPLCKYFNFVDHPDAVESFDNFWRHLIKQGTSLVAIREGPEEERERIIGANVTYIAHKDDKDDVIKTGDLFEYVTRLVIDMSDNVNVFEKYGVDKYLSAVGLSVSEDYHGYKVGIRLLECRKPLCKALGIKLTGTIFTNPISKHIAGKVGFTHLYEEKYAEYRYKGEQVLKDMKDGYAYSILVYD